MEPLYNIQLSTQPQVHYYSKLLLLWSDTISTVPLDLLQALVLNCHIIAT